MAKDTEACGRCSMTVVVDAVDGESGEQERDPFGEQRIEVDQQEMERVSPAAWMGRVSSRVNAAVSRFVWGR
jgi:hypothetical protein